ncbi:MAG: ATP-binding protein [Acidobacteria bacterium]|jgi:DNA transposition AAA+ family ATPase|nr:MAG: ATP-binding protein [Acidobacteriota bacterium]
MRRIPQVTWVFDEGKIIETSAYQATQEWLDEACSSPGIWVLLGEPGVGKTFGATHYALRNRIPYITPPPDRDLTVRRWLRYLAVHLAPDHNPNDDPYYLLCDWAESQPLTRVIIDEAVRLRRPCLDALRDLHDRYPVTIVLIGTSELERKLQHYDTIVHRVCGVWRVPPLNTKDIEALYEVPRDVAATIYSRTGGNYRHLALLIDRLQRVPTTAITTGLVNTLADRYILGRPSKNGKEE